MKEEEDKETIKNNEEETWKILRLGDFCRHSHMGAYQTQHKVSNSFSSHEYMITVKKIAKHSNSNKKMHLMCLTIFFNNLMIVIIRVMIMIAFLCCFSIIFYDIVYVRKKRKKRLNIIFNDWMLNSAFYSFFFSWWLCLGYLFEKKN